MRISFIRVHSIKDLVHITWLHDCWHVFRHSIMAKEEDVVRRNSSSHRRQDAEMGRGLRKGMSSLMTTLVTCILSVGPPNFCYLPK